MKVSKFDVLSKRASSAAMPDTPAGKPASRRGNPDYRQLSAYIPAALYRKVKGVLANSEDLDLSQVVEEALAAWVQRKRD